MGIKILFSEDDTIHKILSEYQIGAYEHGNEIIQETETFISDLSGTQSTSLHTDLLIFHYVYKSNFFVHKVLW